MTTNDANERKPPLELGGRGRDGRGGRRRLPQRRGRVLFFILSVAACGFLTWWLWARFGIRFYFIFIPLIGIGGPIFGRAQRQSAGGETGELRRLLEDRGGRDAEPKDGVPPGEGKT